MADATYQGWRNYETWAVALQWANDQGDYNRWTERAQELFDAEEGETGDRKEAALDKLAEEMKAAVDEQREEIDLAGFMADLLTAAISEVDWHEIAASYTDDVEVEDAAKVVEE